MARFIGSARFIGYMTAFIAFWIVLNTGPWPHPDPFPFIFLTLLLSLQASYAAPLILLAQNRQADRDRVQFQEDRQRTERLLADSDYLAREIAALRKEFALSRQVQAWQDGRHWPPALAPVMQALQEQGVPAGLRALMIDAAAEPLGAENAVELLEREGLAGGAAVAQGPSGGLDGPRRAHRLAPVPSPGMGDPVWAARNTLEGSASPTSAATPMPPATSRRS